MAAYGHGQLRDDELEQAGALLSRRLFFFVGTADTYFLNNAVQLFQQNTDQLTHPATGWSFDYGVNQPHGYSPYTDQELVTIMAQYMADQAPHGRHPALAAAGSEAPREGARLSLLVVRPSRARRLKHADGRRGTSGSVRRRCEASGGAERWLRPAALGPASG